MVQLVIVESPAKCQKIQGFLGAGWRVIASMGHIRALKHELEAVGIHKNFEPSYEFSKTKAKAIKQIKEEAADATEVYLAADDDREGESIAYSVCLLLKLNPATALRSVFHEITETAVKKAIAEPRRLDMNRVHAQQARAMLDMLLGFTLSPLLWRYVGPALSAGRCQTPALRLVVEREDQIRNFTATTSWHLQTQWQTNHGFTFPAEMEDELEDKESAINYMETIHLQSQGSIIETSRKPWTESAPLPLITSTLQQQASAMFSMNPKQTMASAQRLYEAGHITYMRTDHAVLSEEAKKDAKEWVKENYGEVFVSSVEPLEPAKKKKKPKVGGQKEEGSVQGKPAPQEAHEAIRPTHMEVTEITDDTMSSYEKKVYRLIWQRAIQSVMSAAQGETCRVRTQIINDTDFTWTSQWKHTTFEGWRRAGKVADVDAEAGVDGEEESSVKDIAWEKATTLQVGDNITWNMMRAAPNETKAQGRYTEATLVRELEKYGIGRPSTFASLMSAIQDKQYVEITDIPAKTVETVEYTLTANRWPAVEQAIKKKVGAEKKKLIPTELGRSSLHFLLQHFTDLFEYDVTSNMEKRLDKIAEGVESWKQILQDNWESYKERYETLLHGAQLQGKSSAKVREFTNGLKAVQSKKGPLLLIEKDKDDTEFIGWPTGVAFEEITEEAARAYHQEELAKKRGVEMGMWKETPIQKKSGKFGTYLQCGEVSVPFVENEPIEKTIERLEAKAAVKQFKNYAIRSGQYGPYIIKTSIKKTQFVSVPKGININNLTEKDVEFLYQKGAAEKKKWTKKE